MKKQLFKRLLAFSIAVFSIFVSFAQCKQNQVLVCHTSRACDCISCCTICKCVPRNKAGFYLRKGWTLSATSGVAKNAAVNGKNLLANTGSNSLPATNNIMGTKKKI